jgi:hypothetical protein
LVDPPGSLISLASTATKSFPTVNKYFKEKLRISDDKDIEPGKADKSSEDEFAPNILVNLYGLYGKNNIVELALLAFFGILLQLGVLIFSGFTAYSPYLIEKLEGPMASVGFPLQAVGTFFLSLSMMLCSFVVVNATTEKRWGAKENGAENKNSSNCRPGLTEGDKPFRIVWLQKKGVASDQTFGSFLLMAKGPRAEIFTSRRPNWANAGNENIEVSHRKRAKHLVESWYGEHLATFTVAGVVFGILGFIAQFEGFRLSNWSSAIAQLAATFLMTILRALVRRGLNEKPAYKQLHENHEMDWLALEMAADAGFLANFSDSEHRNGSGHRSESLRIWEITTPHSDRSNLALRLKSVAAQKRVEKAFAIRKRLGVLTGWEGPESKQAGITANAIGVVMNKLLQKPGQPFVWRLKVIVDRAKFPEEIEFGFEAYNPDDKKPWKAVVAEIDAALSLWKYYVSKTSYKQCRRVLGPDTNTLHQDLTWWVGDGVAQESRANPQGTNDTLWVGFDGLEADGKDLGKLSKLRLSLRRGMSQHRWI